MQYGLGAAASCWNRTHIGLTVTCLKHWVRIDQPKKAIGSYRSTKKNGISNVISRNLEPKFLIAWFSFSDCSSRTLRLDKIYQNLWQQTFWSIHITALDIFTQFLLKTHSGTHGLHVTSEKWVRTDLRVQVLHGWSGTHKTIILSIRLLKKSLNWKSKLVFSMLVCTWLAICSYALF